MKILIAEKIVTGMNNDSKFKAAMEEIAGIWVEVETEYLFENQYNVTTPSGHGIRIMEEYVRGIQDDARTGKGRCNYCGKVSEYTGLDLCPKCGHYGCFKEFQNVEKQHTVEVNRNWKLMYTTKCGSLTPYGYAEVEIMNVKTGEVFKAQKWQYWSTLRIQKKVPQAVKNALRNVFEKYRMSYRHISENDWVERTW